MVDPEFNFHTEEASVGHKRDRWSHDKRIWELFEPHSAPIDGVLISRMVFERSGEFRKNEFEERGVREFLRLPPSLNLMGDCGAFGYVNQPNPPYGPVDTLEFYRKAGVDVGVTVDHLIVRSILPSGYAKPRLLTRSEKQERWALSVKNALT